MKKLARLLALLFSLSAADSWAGWNSISQTLVERDAHVVASHAAPSTASVLYAGFKGSLQSSEDGGRSWKARLKLRSSASRVLCLAFGASTAQTLFVGTDEGLYRSVDAGKKWERIYQHADEEREKVIAVAEDQKQDRAGRIFVGTSSGLFVSDDSGVSWKPEPFFNGQNIYQIDTVPDGGVLVASARGLYRSDEGGGWVERYRLSRRAGEESLQGDSDDLASSEAGGEDSLYFWRPDGALSLIVLLDDRQVLVSVDGGLSWKSDRTTALPFVPSSAPVGFSEAGDLLLLPTGGGVFVLDRKSGSVSSANWGLPTGDIRRIFYDKNADSILVATDRGVFSVDHPETMIALNINSDNVRGKSAEILKYFENEPSVQDLQLVAMRYAEVYPEKILQWRLAAARKPFLPTLSIGRDRGNDQTVDIDRGGTADPDRFIFGPEESDSNLSVDVSWDLGELLWNDDQTSIDNRSKLMVQLREDLLSQLTHLYFARRRLQIQAVLASRESPMVMIERELQIQEYTAGIDALTGGYLTKKLTEKTDLADAVSGPHSRE